MLAKRLINHLSASNDYEELMISKLKVNSYLIMKIFNRFSFFFSKHVVLNIPQNYNECWKMQILVKI